MNYTSVRIIMDYNNYQEHNERKFFMHYNNILEELYNGNIYPCEKSFNHDTEYIKLLNFWVTFTILKQYKNIITPNTVNVANSAAKTIPG